MTARDRALANGLQRRLEQIKGRGEDAGQIIQSYEEGLKHLLQGGLKYELDALDKLTEFIAYMVRKRAPK